MVYKHWKVFAGLELVILSNSLNLSIVSIGFLKYVIQAQRYIVRNEFFIEEFDTIHIYER
jgi:hypothetical protein